MGWKALGRFGLGPLRLGALTGIAGPWTVAIDGGVGIPVGKLGCRRTAVSETMVEHPGYIRQKNSQRATRNKQAVSSHQTFHTEHDVHANRKFFCIAVLGNTHLLLDISFLQRNLSACSQHLYSRPSGDSRCTQVAFWWTGGRRMAGSRVG
jgi:hypothetical protein